MRQFCGEALPRVRSVSPARRPSHRRHDLEPGDEMHIIGEVGQTTTGSAPASYWLAQFANAAAMSPLHQRFEQIDDAGAVGQAEHLRARSSARSCPPPWAIA
jgi:hypothetical protein